MQQLQETEEFLKAYDLALLLVESVIDGIDATSLIADMIFFGTGERYAKAAVRRGLNKGDFQLGNELKLYPRYQEGQRL